jgi:hypothetical protein
LPKIVKAMTKIVRVDKLPSLQGVDDKVSTDKCTSNYLKILDKKIM